MTLSQISPNPDGHGRSRKDGLRPSDGRDSRHLVFLNRGNHRAGLREPFASACLTACVRRLSQYLRRLVGLSDIALCPLLLLVQRLGSIAAELPSPTGAIPYEVLSDLLTQANPGACTEACTNKTPKDGL